MKRQRRNGWVWKGMGIIIEDRSLLLYRGITVLHGLSEVDGGPGPVPKHLGLPWYKTVSGILINLRRLNKHVIVMFRRDDGW